MLSNTELLNRVTNQPKRFEVCFSGALDMTERLHFDGHQFNDALTLAARKITEFETNPNVTAAYVTVSRLPDEVSSAGRSVFSWTKAHTDYPRSSGKHSE